MTNLTRSGKAALWRRASVYILRCWMLTCLTLAATTCQQQTTPQNRPGNVVVLRNSNTVVVVGKQMKALAPDGSVLWTVSLPEEVIAPLASAPNSNVFARSQSALYAVNHAGKLQWSAELPAPSSALSYEALAPAALADSSAVVLVSTREMRNIAANGSKRWTAHLPVEATQSPVLACPNGQTVVRAGGKIFGVSPDGKLLWESSTTQ